MTRKRLAKRSANAPQGASLLPPEVWTYKGIDVFPVSGGNSSGIRWYARHPEAGTLRADTKASMRDLINENRKESSS